MEVLCGLAGLAFVLAVVAVVGHGLWLLGSAIVGAGAPRTAERVCPTCRRANSADRTVCEFCGHRFAQPPISTIDEELEAAKRQITRLRSKGRLAPATAAEVLDAIREDLLDRRVVKSPIELVPPDVEPLAPISPTAPPPVTVSTPPALVPQTEVARAEVPVPIPRPLAVVLSAPTESAIEAPAAPEVDETRGLAGILQAFMEQKNIRWAELVSGLLIVGSSVGLVVSLWATLKEAIPYFPVAVFLAATAALHGAGRYTLSRWNLKTTSRGLLLVSTLLLPLNVLAAIALRDKTPVYTTVDYVAVTLGLAVMAVLSISAARVLNKRNPWPLVIALMGTVAGSFAIGRLAAPQTDAGRVILLFALPFGTFLVGSIAHVLRLSAGRRLSVIRTVQSFRFLGIAAFGLVIAAGLLVWKCQDIRGTLALLSPMASVLAATITATGLVVHQRTTAASQASLRMAGTSIALGGGSLVVVGLLLAWPRPDLLVAVGLLDAVTFSVLAAFAGLPALHVFANAALSLAILVGIEWGSGQITVADATSAGLAALLLRTRSALIVCCLSLLADAAGCVLARTKARVFAQGYFASAMLEGAVSVAIAAAAVWHAAPDRYLATVVFALLALRWLIASWWMVRGYASWIAAVLLLAALGHGLGMNPQIAEALTERGLLPLDRWTIAFLVDATICAAYAAFARLIGRRSENAARETELVLPFSVAAVIVSSLAIPAMIAVPEGRFFAHAGYVFWTGAVWFAVALLQESAPLAVATQALATVGVVYAVIGHCRRQDWWNGLYSEPLFLNWQFAALAAWSGLWIGVRRIGSRINLLSRLLVRTPTTLDRLLLGGVVVGLVGTCFVATLPGILAELATSGPAVGGPRPFFAFVLIPFGVGAILTATRAVFPLRRLEAAAVGTSLVLVCIGILSAPVIPGIWTWPGSPNPYGTGWGAGAWFALVIAALTLLAAHGERPTRITLAGIPLLAAIVPFLIACRWDSELAAASALRWASALAGLAVAVVWSLSGPLKQFGRRLSDDPVTSPARAHGVRVRNLLFATTSLPIVLLSAQNLVALVGQGRVAAGPIAESPFGRIGPIVSYAGPLAILVAVLLVYAIVDRRVSWGTSATFLAQFTFGLVACSMLALTPGWTTLAEFVHFLQEMGIASGVAAIVWFGIEPFIIARRKADLGDLSLLEGPADAQVLLTTLFTSLLVIGATVGIWLAPAPLDTAVRECGSVWGWILLALATVTGVWSARRDWPRSAFSVGLLFFAAVAPQAAASLANWNSPGNWLSMHVLLTGWCGLIGVTSLILTAVRSPAARAATRVIADRTLILVPLVALFAFRAEWDDPLRPWWAVGAMLSLALFTTLFAAALESRLRSYLSLALTLIGAIFIGLRPWLDVVPAGDPHAVLNLIQTWVLGITLYGVVWLAIEVLWDRRRRQAFDPSSTLPASHHVVAVVGTIALVLTTLWMLAAQVRLDWLQPPTRLDWGTLTALGLLAFASLWDARAKYTFPLLYTLGLTAIALFLDWRLLPPRDLVYAAAYCGAAYVVLTGVAWLAGAQLKAIGSLSGIRPEALDARRVSPWLPPVNLAIGCLVIGVEFLVVLTFENPNERICGALATGALAAGVALLAQHPWRRALQTIALVIGAIASVQIGWALMDVLGTAPHEELRRTIRMMAMLAAAAFIYGVPLVRIFPATSSWNQSIRRAAIGVAVTAIAALALVLLFEFQSFDPIAGAPVAVADAVVVSVALVGLAAALISLALLPGRDPFLVSEKQRFQYVYASEAVIGLLLAHLYLTNPQIFHGRLQPYWPLIVMAIAYFGTGLSELFRRLKVTVLAQPLEYTSAFLPILPVIGFWFLSSHISYSTTLVAVGLLHLFLSLRRRSFVYAAAAAIAGNATLCTLFYEHGISLLLHPQMFVIPPCLTILAAAQINRDRLEASALATARYFAITTIYVTSTGEMFQRGIGTTLWLPMVLAGLSVLGVLAGIVLRVRAFLYLGTSFLLLSIVSMVWHAARSIGHVWPWWAFLFTLGVALVILLGVFEKKRAEVLVLIERMRQWER